MFSYETNQKPLIPLRKFARRLLWNFFISALLIFGALLIGMVGYHCICDLCWVDALYNASMILTGMGPVAVLTTDAAKIFASFYALFSGIVFLTTIAVVLAPVIHRFLHAFHIQDSD